MDYNYFLSNILPALIPAIIVAVLSAFLKPIVIYISKYLDKNKSRKRWKNVSSISEPVKECLKEFHDVEYPDITSKSTLFNFSNALIPSALKSTLINFSNAVVPLSLKLHLQFLFKFSIFFLNILTPLIISLFAIVLSLFVFLICFIATFLIIYNFHSIFIKVSVLGFSYIVLNIFPLYVAFQYKKNETNKFEQDKSLAEIFAGFQSKFSLWCTFIYSTNLLSLASLIFYNGRLVLLTSHWILFFYLFSLYFIGLTFGIGAFLMANGIKDDLLEFSQKKINQNFVSKFPNVSLVTVNSSSCEGKLEYIFDKDVIFLKKDNETIAIPWDLIEHLGIKSQD